MKKLSLLLFLLLNIINISACSCVWGTLPQNYENAEVVGIIKILKVYGENKQQRTYKADIEFEKVYKGKAFKTISVEGLIRKSSLAACEIGVKSNERYLIFLNKFNNSYSMSYCTPKSRLKNKADEDERSELEDLGKTFSYLDNNRSKFKGLQFTYCYDDSQTGYKSDLSKISDFMPKQPFAIYKVKINELSKIEEMTPIESFGSKDNIIEDILKTKMKVSRPMNSQDLNQQEFLLFLSYNKENINNPYGEVISCN